MRGFSILLLSTAFTSVLCETKKEKLMLSTGEEVKILSVDNRLTIYCNVFHENGKTHELSWVKNDAPLEADDHITISQYEETVKQKEAVNNYTQKTVSKLRIPKAKEEDIGFYDCKTKEKPVITKKFIVTSISFKYLPKSTEVNEETELSLSCYASGDEYLKPVVQWFKEEEHLENAVNVSKLMIYDNSDGLAEGSFNLTGVDQSDRGHYTCSITFEENLVFNTTTNVRVKDPLRALWPFLGIVVQGIVLAITIFMCEKMRTKEGDDDSDDDSNIGTAAGTST